MRSCLVVDDSSVVRKVAGRILASYDVSVAEASTGAEALEFAGASPHLLILVAGVLPDMAGEEFVKRLRMTGSTVPTIAMLVESNLGQMTRLKRAGASGFVLKPFDRMSLTMRLDSYLRLAEAA